jgi:4-carboxymuconolactone decarboxylase
MDPSNMMNALYGPKYAEEVMDRLTSIDPAFGQLARDVAYEVFWARPGLDIKTKSLVTTVALLALGKEEQSKIHITGFLNAGGTEGELRAAILHLAVYCGFPTAMTGLSILNSVLKPEL